MCTAQDKKIKDLTKELAATQAFMREEIASIKKSFKKLQVDVQNRALREEMDTITDDLASSIKKTVTDLTLAKG